MSSTRQTKASNSYRLIPRTTGANTVQQNCWKVSGFRLIKEKGNPVKLRSDEANRLEPGVDFAVENTARNTPGCKTSGAFHCTKISGNFGPNINGTVRPRWKFSGKSGPPPEVVLFDRSVQSDQKLLFHFQKFSFPVLLQLVTTHSRQNGGWFRCRGLWVRCV